MFTTPSTSIIALANLTHFYLTYILPGSRKIFVLLLLSNDITGPLTVSTNIFFNSKFNFVSKFNILGSSYRLDTQEILSLKKFKRTTFY